MLNVLLAGTLAVSMIGAPVLEVPAAQPLPDITVEMVDLNGTGCPPGTTAVAVSPDETAFTVTYSAYMAQVGVGAGAADFRKNCGVTVDVNVPEGFTYAIVSADYRGYAFLANGASGLHRANYYFQGMEEDVFTQETFRGPMDDFWQVTEEAEFPVFAPCGGTRHLEINTELRVNAGTSDTSRTTSLMSMDSEDHAITTTYHVDLRAC